MYCKKCGKELPDNSKFCSACGTAQPKVINSNKSSESKNKNKKIALIGIVILVMIVIAGIKHYTKGETQLIGRWDVYNKHISEGDIAYIVRSGDIVEFCKDGTVLYNDIEGKYNVISNNKLTIEINGELYSFKYKMQWDWSGKHGLTLKYKGKSLDLVKIKD